jgi:hypothetical protein
LKVKISVKTQLFSRYTNLQMYSYCCPTPYPQPFIFSAQLKRPFYARGTGIPVWYSGNDLYTLCYYIQFSSVSCYMLQLYRHCLYGLLLAWTVKTQFIFVLNSAKIKKEMSLALVDTDNPINNMSLAAQSRYRRE